MQKYDIHVCLVSEQAAPNLLPILDSNFKPKEAILLVSPQMKKQADFLTSTFENKGVKVNQKNLTDVFDFESTENEIIELIQKYENEHIALNVTGGTKLLAIAAQNTFLLAEKPIFYIDTNKNRIVFITKDKNNQRIEDQSLNTKLDIKTYLSAYGSQVISQGEPNKKEYYIEMRDNFIKQYDNYSKVIPTLNFYASKTTKNNLTVKFDHTEYSEQILNFINKLHCNDLLDFKDGMLNFYNEENRDFVAGGWLEDYVLEQVKSINTVQDCLLNIEVGNAYFNQNKEFFDKNNQGNLNEFDIAFIANNRLHLIECKTQSFNKEAKTKGDDILYKLETLKDYGGLMTKKCLVSYFDVPEAVKNRAKTLNIEIIQGKELQQLKSRIQNWIGKR